MNTKSRKKVALVIGSGGIKCAASIGVMQVLKEEGIPVDMVVGCSGGSVFGAAIALGFSPPQLEEARAKAWTSDVTSRINYKKIASIFAPKLLKFDETFAIFDDSIMSGHIAEIFGEETTFADTLLPFYCVATDFFTGETYVMSEGPLAKAVRCSSGIPMVFGALDWEGTKLIDGALSNPLPIDVAIKEGADVIIAVGFSSPVSDEVSSIWQFAGQMFNILVNQMFAKKLGFYQLSHYMEVILMMPELDDRIRVNDVEKVPSIIEQGAVEARHHIPYLKNLLQE